MRTSWVWATVTDSDPLLVTIDGDTDPLEISPDTLIDPSTLDTGDRVRCEIIGRRLIIHGKAVTTPAIPDSFTGEIRAYAGATAPPGWLICNGATIPRAEYPDLFAVIGTTWGQGNGTTTFTLPNLKGRTLVGLDTAQTEFATLGKTGGEKSHQLTSDEMPSHSHTITGNGALTDGAGGTLYGVQNGTYYGFRTGQPASTGGGQGHNNLQPFAVVNWIIKT